MRRPLVSYRTRATRKIVAVLGFTAFALFTGHISSNKALSADVLTGTPAVGGRKEGAWSSPELVVAPRQTAPQRTASRRLANCPRKPGWPLTVMWILVVVYLFLATAVVCDELFVPSLEIIAEKWSLSDDVSGATLMAAGGSAPELATSFIGTFTGSDVGFGTIVGSAVFNVLFVIGMCVMFTPPRFAPLELTWWPLFRDCTYYIITLAMLGIWFAVTSPGKIELWEAIVQLLLYVGYVVLMSQNEKVEAAFTRLFGITDAVEAKGATTNPVMPSPTSSSSSSPDVKEQSSDNFNHVAAQRRGTSRRSAVLRRPMGFRTGISRMLLGQADSFVNSQGAAVVMQLSGEMDETFAKLDKNGSGTLDVGDMKRLVTHLATMTGDPEIAQQKAVTSEKIELLFAAIDTNKDGQISKAEFRDWYLSSETRLKAEMHRIFNEFDTNNDGSIDVEEVECYLKELHNGSTPEELTAALNEFVAEVGKTGARVCTYPEFVSWYETTMLWKSAQENAEDALSSLWDSTLEALRTLDCSLTTVGILLVAPINLLLGFTVMDCRVPDNAKYCYQTFFSSIAWIFGFSYVMVLGIEAMGAQFGVPVFIMALTFLAAGTSVPDLLSSVVVAKQGKGDMAVSSSIGSNIFDVAIGLPLPWLLWTAINYPKPIVVGNAGTFVSLAILTGMVVLVVGSIAASDWKMSKPLGYAMFCLYFLFLAQEVYRKYPFNC